MAASVAALACLVVLAPSDVEAAPAEDDGPQCYLHADVTVERQLRRLSLDLRGYAPTYEEYALVDGKSEVPEEVIDAFIASDAFRLQSRRYHESILWTNPKGVSFSQGANSIGSTNFSPGNPVWRIRDNGTQRRYRGGDRTHICQDKPQSELGYDANGIPISEFMGTDADGDWYAEGWVEVSPYWAPDTTIKVCAFDAQAALTYTKMESGQPVEYTCADRFGSGQKSCGCGPNLRWCIRGNFQATIWEAMREQVLLLVDDHTDGSRKYSELLTTKRAHYNGTLMHYRKLLAPKVGIGRTYNDYMPEDGTFPVDDDIDWTDTNWTEIERSGGHAGILTLPAYTLRFQTNRGRANRFRIAFAGQYFQPPDVGDYDGCEVDTDDLSSRCICRKCHETLEPLAAYFGQIVEAGSTVLTGFAESYQYAAECNKVGGVSNSNFCRRLYAKVTSELDKDYKVWRLHALEYADDAHPAIKKNFDQGPAGIAKWAIDGGLFARATVTNLFQFLYHREMLLDPSHSLSEAPLLSELSAELQEHDDFKRIVKRLVSLPQYRRTP